MKLLSLGAGVQSTTLLLMAVQGEIEKPDAAIFADTGWEPNAVYAHLDWLQGITEKAGIPVHRVSAGSLRDDLLAAATGTRTRVGNPPYHTTPDGILHRNCTREYKLEPIRRKTRELSGGKPVEQWIGISWDESERMKPSGVKYITNRFPLIERRMTRVDCLKWMESHGYPLPGKSSCLGCPYHSNRAWAQIRDESPDEWADTVMVDRVIREGLPGVAGKAHMHRSHKPLAEVNLTPEDRGQRRLWEGEWAAECTGMCGV